MRHGDYIPLGVNDFPRALVAMVADGAAVLRREHHPSCPSGLWLGPPRVDTGRP